MSMLGRGGGRSGERAGTGGDGVEGEVGECGAEEREDESDVKLESLNSEGGGAKPTRRERGIGGREVIPTASP